MSKLKTLNPFLLLPIILILGLAFSGFYNTFYIDFIVESPRFNSMFIQDKVSFKTSERSRRHTRALKRQRRSYLRKGTKVEQVVSNFEPSNIGNKVNEKAELKKSLDLKLIEFFNPTHFDNVLKGDQVDGYLEANNGVIETLEISLPDGKSISVAQSMMNGSHFNYNHEGEIYSGMIFQSGNKNYTVSLMNGPYKGSKMKFSPSFDDFNNRQISYDQSEEVSVNNFKGNETHTLKRSKINQSDDEFIDDNYGEEDEFDSAPSTAQKSDLDYEVYDGSA